MKTPLEYVWVLMKIIKFPGNDCLCRRPVRRLDRALLFQISVVATWKDDKEKEQYAPIRLRFRLAGEARAPGVKTIGP
jgi:hypothetical protein